MSDNALEKMSEGVGHVLMAAEELRRSLQPSDASVDCLLQWQSELDGILTTVGTLSRLCLDSVDPTVQDLFRNCEIKALQVSQQVFDKSLEVPEPKENNTEDTCIVPIDDVRRNIQSAVARIIEINLILLVNASSNPYLQDCKTPQEIIDCYVLYQKQTIRKRVKPVIASLVEKRQQGIELKPVQKNFTMDEDESTASYQYHAPVMTCILGQAAVLIHPLIEWHSSLPPDDHVAIVGFFRKMCINSIASINDQAQILVKTLSDWFWEDRPIEKWIQKSAGDEHIDSSELTLLDGLVEEMSFICRVLARYQSLIESFEHNGPSMIAKELLPEWTWKYATLERFLAVEQWKAALTVATPVFIVIGSAVQVPSVVEDAQYLSTRALERAASTGWTQAIGTVAHAISHDIWSDEMSGGVHQALLDRSGCWTDSTDKKEEIKDTAPNSGNAFASALLDALDEDLDSAQRFANKGAKRTLKKSPVISAPNSGGFLNSFAGKSDKMVQMELDAQFCLLNGFHAAAGACRALVDFLDSLLLSKDTGEEERMQNDDKVVAMIQLSREELFRYAGSYEVLLKKRIDDTIETWCGTGPAPSRDRPNLFLSYIHLIFEKETFNLDSNQMATMEADERLERLLIEPLRESKFLSQISAKCESEVLILLGEAIIHRLSLVIIDALCVEGRVVTEWGALLFAKELRMLHNFMLTTLSTKTGDIDAYSNPSLLQAWEAISQISTLLQIEKPIDWLVYHKSSDISLHQLRAILLLRKEFAKDAVESLISSIEK